MLELSPNPAHNNLNVEFDLQENTTVKIMLTNGSGVDILLQEDIALNKGAHRLNFDVSNYSAGVYICKIITENSAVITQKIIIY